MSLIRKLMGKEDKFYDWLEASSEEARTSVRSLLTLVDGLGQSSPPSLEGFDVARRKDKEITRKISEELCHTFVTPLEREDIESLSHALYRIPKTVEKIGARLMISPEHFRKEDFAKQIGLLEQAAEAVVQMVGLLRKTKDLERVKEINERLQTIEGEADKLMIELLRELYSGKREPVNVIALKDLYELIEKVIDRCRDAGNVVFYIVLKYT